MEKLINCFWLMVLILFSGFSQASEHPQSKEEFFFEMNGETLSDGSQVYIRYDISLSYSNKLAYVKVTTWHAPAPCEGNYEIKETDGEYSLYYLGGKDACMYPSPQFNIVNKGGEMYIKGMPLIYEPGGWLKLSHK